MDKNFTLHRPKSFLTSYYPDLIYEILGLIKHDSINKTHRQFLPEAHLSGFISIVLEYSTVFTARFWPT